MPNNSNDDDTLTLVVSDEETVVASPPAKKPNKRKSSDYATKRQKSPQKAEKPGYDVTVTTSAAANKPGGADRASRSAAAAQPSTAKEGASRRQTRSAAKSTPHAQQEEAPARVEAQQAAPQGLVLFHGSLENQFSLDEILALCPPQPAQGGPITPHFKKADPQARFYCLKCGRSLSHVTGHTDKACDNHRKTLASKGASSPCT